MESNVETGRLPESVWEGDEEMRDGFIIHEKTLKQMARLSPEDTKYLMECLTTYYSTGEIDIDKVQETSIVVAVILDDAIERMDLDKQG